MKATVKVRDAIAKRMVEEAKPLQASGQFAKSFDLREARDMAQGQLNKLAVGGVIDVAVLELPPAHHWAARLTVTVLRELAASGDRPKAGTF